MFDDQPIFAFRGKRTYLSATTVFDWLLQQLDSPTNIDFQFHQFTKNQCKVVSKTSLEDQIVATYRSNEEKLYLVDTEVAIDSNYPCNEQLIVGKAKISIESGHFEMPPIENASYIESIVVIYKEMLSKTEDGGRGKLIFGRVKLNRVPETGQCEVRHRRKIGDKFFEATLFCNDEKIGALYFGQH